jgi:PAS domain S-box-containing protein
MPPTRPADVVWYADENLNLTYVGPLIYELTGFTRAEIRNTPRSRRFPPESIALMAKAEKKLRTEAAAGGGRDLVLRLEVDQFRKDGRRITTEITAMAVLHDDGTPAGYRGVVRDVTRHPADENPNPTLSTPAEVTPNCHRFLADIIHEIRTPLNALIGAVELMTTTEDPEKQKQFAETALTAGGILSSLVDDVLDLAGIEAGKLDLKRVNFDVYRIIEDVAVLLTPKARQKGISLKRFVSADLPAPVRGDPDRLKQVLINLVSNAVKYTDQGSVKIHAGVLSETKDNVTFVFSVTDTGVGISEKERPHLFREFVRLDSGRGKKPGTGLGLVIARKIVALMGGEIHVDSVLGAGSEFRFTAVLEKGSPAAMKTTYEPAPAVRKGHRILIVDDDELNRMVTAEILAKYGFQTKIVETGEEALTALGASVFDAVIMDIHLPGSDGLAIARRIRDSDFASENRSVPIISLTADPRYGKDLNWKQSGVNDCLSKPVSGARLIETLEQHLPLKENKDDTAETETAGFGEETVPHFDADQLLTRLEYDRCLFVRVLKSFFRDVPDQIKNLKTLLSKEDTAAAVYQAHKLKGVFDTVSMEQLGQIARQIESESAEGRFENAAASANALEKTFNRLKQRLMREGIA